MPHVVHQNSLFAWTALQPKLATRQKEVLTAYTEPLTDEEVSRKLNWPINRICGRVGELIKAGLLRELTPEETSIRGRRVCKRISN